MQSTSRAKRMSGRIRSPVTWQIPLTGCSIEMCFFSWRVYIVGPFSVKNKCPVASLLQLETGPKCSGRRCSLNIMEESQIFNLPTIYFYSSLPEQAEGRESHTPSGGTSLAWQYRTINTLRSAISITHEEINSIRIGEHPMVSCS